MRILKAFTDSATRWRHVLKDRNVRWLYAGQLISQIGDGVTKVALLWFVYNTTESALKMTLIGVLQTVPPLVFGPFAGVVLDRMSKRTAMIVIDLVRTGLLILVPVLYALGHLSLAWLYVLVFVIALFSMAFGPALNATLPRLVKKDQLIGINALMQSALTVGQLFGPALSGILIAVITLDAEHKDEARQGLAKRVVIEQRTSSAPVVNPRDELARIGYAGTEPLGLHRPHAYVELHIERLGDATTLIVKGQQQFYAGGRDTLINGLNVHYYQIVGQRVAGSGQLLGTTIAITGSTTARPDVAYNPSRDEYLVVYQTFGGADYAIQGRIVSGDGAPGSVVSVSAEVGSSETNPTVAYNSMASAYLAS